MVDVAAARRQLGIDRLVLGIHDGCFPGDPDEDVGRGSPYSRGAARFYAFLARLGFDGVQLGPQGQTSIGNLSPYDASIFARDFLSVALGPLARDPRFQHLLAERTLAEPVAGRPAGDRRVHQRYAWTAATRALDEAYAAFRARGGELGAAVRDYRAEEEAWIRRRSVPDFERHVFEQFLIYRQHQDLRAAVPGLRIYGDLQIGMPPEDVAVLRDLFLSQYRMGAPPSRTNPAGQPWGYPVFDPRKRDEVVAFNVPGSVNDDNWTLRVPGDLETWYRADVAAGRALDLDRCFAWASAVREETGPLR